MPKVSTAVACFFVMAVLGGLGIGYIQHGFEGLFVAMIIAGGVGVIMWPLVRAAEMFDD